jgi:hypothetical protein
MLEVLSGKNTIEAMLVLLPPIPEDPSRCNPVFSQYN